MRSTWRKPDGNLTDAKGKTFRRCISDGITDEGKSMSQIQPLQGRKCRKRLDQWDYRCGTKQRERIILEWWPGTVEKGGDVVNGGGLLEGSVVAGMMGPYCHRLERTVRLELGDLVLSQQYIRPAFPEIGASSVKKADVVTRQRCAECIVLHNSPSSRSFIRRNCT